MSFCDNFISKLPDWLLTNIVRGTSASLRVHVGRALCIVHEAEPQPQLFYISLISSAVLTQLRKTTEPLVYCIYSLRVYHRQQAISNFSAGMYFYSLYRFNIVTSKVPCKSGFFTQYSYFLSVVNLILVNHRWSAQNLAFPV